MLRQDVDDRLAAACAGDQVFANDREIRPHDQPAVECRNRVLGGRRSSINVFMPSGGRPLVIVKAIPASMIVRTTARARGVRILSGVTSVPSTSATTRRTEFGTVSFTADRHARP